VTVLVWPYFSFKANFEAEDSKPSEVTERNEEEEGRRKERDRPG
jgi:hypothetical protein